LKSGLWVRLARFAILAPDGRHHRRFQAGIPLMAVSELGQPPLSEVGTGALASRVGNFFHVPSPL
jgi:hypothetical protein